MSDAKADEGSPTEATVPMPPEQSGPLTGWADYFLPVPGPGKARKKCSLCPVEVDVRAGRGRKHLKDAHGIATEAAVEPPGRSEPPQEPAASGFPRGSREWAVERLQNLVDGPGLSPSEQLKALAELRTYENFEGAAKFDDEIEREKYLAQWKRGLSRAKEIREVERRLFKDPTLRQDVARAIAEAAS